MRRALFPDSEAGEVDVLLGGQDPSTVTFVAERRTGGAGPADALAADAPPAGEARAFAEVGLRRYAEGGTTSPLAYLEGIWVDPGSRRVGVAIALVRLAGAWGVALGLQELASDVEPDNAAGIGFHRAAGFEDTGTVMCFRARLGSGEAPG